MIASSWTVELAAWLIESSWYVLPPAVLVLLIERCWHRAWPELLGLSWGLVLLRFALPPQTFAALAPVGAGLPGPPLVPDGAPAGWLVPVLLLWAAVALSLLVVPAWRAGRLARVLRAEASAAPGSLGAQIAALARGSGLRRTPVVAVHPSLRSPLLIGLYRPTVLLPRTMVADGGRGLAAALAHEFAHLRRRDAWRSAAAASIRAAFWFHPVAWLAAARLRALREFACDRRATRVLGGDVQGYVRALVALAGTAPARAAGLAWIGPEAELVRRVERLVRPARLGARRIALASWLLATGLTVCCVPARIAAPELPLPVAGCLQLRFLVLGMLAEQGAAEPDPVR